MARKSLTDIVGPIKRIVRQDGLFVCGICQQSHEKWPEALACLWNCWKSFLALTPVVIRKKSRIINYRCRYCARDYDIQSKAHECAAVCGEYSRKEFELEWALLGFIPPFERKTKTKPVVIVVQKLPSKPKKPKKVLSDGNQNPDEAGVSPESTQPQNPPAPAGETSAPAPSQPAQDNAAAAAPAKKEKTYGYYREGARYVCESCSGKYFTKQEVINCVKSHQ